MEDIKIQLNNSVKAVSSHFQAEKDRAIADLEIYLNRPVGVGDHSSVLDDTIKIFEKLEHAKSMLEMINSMTLGSDTTAK
jgi:hypothetical protein